MIRLNNVSKIYETGNKAVRNLNLTIEDGEFVFIVGKSGSGKSTLLKLITRELIPTEGKIEVNGIDLNRIKKRDIPKYRRMLGVIFQDFRLLNDRNVFENIAFAQRVIGAGVREIKENVPKMLKLTGLSSKYKNMPNQLSGGEQQRVAIARALINKPSIILADEPTGNLDEANSKEIMNILEEINRMGTTVVVITHSKAMIREMNKRVITMDKGVIISDVVPVKIDSNGDVIEKKELKLMDTGEFRHREKRTENKSNVVRRSAPSQRSKNPNVKSSSRPVQNRNINKKMESRRGRS